VKCEALTKDIILHSFTISEVNICDTK